MYHNHKSAEAFNSLKDSYPKPPFFTKPQPGPGLEANLHPRPNYLAPTYKGSNKLENQVALITGGDSGIGRAVAVLFAREGANITFVYLPEEERDARETVAAIKAEGREAYAIPGDVRKPAFCTRAVRDTLTQFGRLDILVNNAAYQQHQEEIKDVSIAQWTRTFETNIYAYFYMVKAAVPFMHDGAVIINTGSITGLEGSAELLDYSATKGAIHAFTKSLAKSLVKKGIRVNCVAPGPVWTPLNPSERSSEDIKDFGADIPYGRPAQPEEIAPTFVYLASNIDSHYVTGEIVSLLGGQTTAS